MENDFVVNLNDMPIDCNENFILSNFPNLYNMKEEIKEIQKKEEEEEEEESTQPINEKQRTIHIEGGNDFYEVTKDILQGNRYEITNENCNYLIELSKILKFNKLQTDLNVFCYKRECDDHQIDQHPTIQFLIELSSLIRQLSTANYEDYSSQIKEKLNSSNKNERISKNKRRKLEKNKEKNNQKKKRKPKKESEDSDDENKEEKEMSLKNLSKLTLSSLFYYEIVNNLSSSFHSADEFQEHKNKAALIVKLIQELDSISDDESDSYLDNFIDFVIAEYKRGSASNYYKETLYLVNLLITEKLLKIDKLKYDIRNNQRNFMYPDYFLHFYPPDMIHKYFKNNSELIKKDDEEQSDESNYARKLKSKKEKQKRNAAFEEKIKEYIKNHQKKIEEGLSFNDDLLNIIIDDDLDHFQNYFKDKIEKTINLNEKYDISAELMETYVSSYHVPFEITAFSCVTALKNCGIFDLTALFGSRNIFQYLCDNNINNRSQNIYKYIIDGRDSKIIEIYLDFLGKKTKLIKQNQQNKDENEKDKQEEEEEKEEEKEKLRQLINKVKINAIYKMMPYCVYNGDHDLYNFLYNYLLQLKDEEEDKNINDSSKLNEYLVTCINRGYFEFIPYLLREGVTTNTLLNLFCKTDNKIGVEYMLEFSYIDVNDTYNGQMPLEYCINNKNTETSLLLLKDDRLDHKNLLDNIFINTCSNGLSKVVEYFLKNNIFSIAIKTSEGFRPIHLACKSGDFETVKTLVDIKKKAVKVNLKVTKGTYKGYTPLHFACISGNTDIVKLLLDRYKVNVNLKGAIDKWTPLQFAVRKGHSEIVRILLEQEGIETDLVTDEGENLLHLACMSNKEDIVDMLINNPDLPTKFDLNKKTLNERTPLQIALTHENCKMISVLLNIDENTKRRTKKKSNKTQSDIDPNILTNNGQSPLIIACEMRRMDIFNLLLKHTKIDVNIQLSTGKSALYVACELNLIEKLKILLGFKEIKVNTSTKMGKTPLIVSCEKGNKQVVEILIQHNNENRSKNKKNKQQADNLINFNAKTNEGKTALLISCEYSRMDIVEMLLTVDEIECDDATFDGRTPLCYACDKNNENIVDELIKHNANVNYCTPNMKSILYFACCSQNPNIVKSILSKIDDKTQINKKEMTNGTTPLYVACKNGDGEIYNLLIQEISDCDLNYQDFQGKSLLFAACEGENLEIIESLLTKYNVNPNISKNAGETPLRFCIEKKNHEMFNLILNNSQFEIDINERLNDVSLLEYACEKGCFEIIQTLLKKEGIQVNPIDKEIPPILCSCKFWRPDIINLLLDEVPDIDVNVAMSDGRRAIHYACEKGDVDICRKLLSINSENVSIRTTDKKTPLELACKNGSAEVIGLLLKYIGDIQINSKFYDGNTILTKACIQQSADIVKFLLENTPVDVNATNNNEKTALFIVAENGNEQLCQMLLNHEKIDINIMKNQKTPLYEACKYGNASVVELLLKKGARADCKTKNGKTPLHVACQHGFNKVVTLLLNCPEVDVNLLTVSQNDTKVFYTPLHYACLNKNFYSKSRSTDSSFNRTGGFGSSFNRTGGGFGSSFNRTGGFGSSFNRTGGFGSSFNRTGGFGSAPKIDDDDEILRSRKNVAKGNQQLCVELLLHHPQIDINLQSSKNETALTIACNNQKFDVIKVLLQSSQIDPNVQGNSNNTALHIACQNLKIDLVQSLLNNPNTDVNVCNYNDQTPLSIACTKDKINLVKLLLKREDLNVCLPSQENPIRKAIKNNNKELFTILLNHPSFDINASDSNGATPLAYAIESQNINFTLQILLTPKIDVNKKSSTSSLNINNNNNRGWGYSSYRWGSSSTPNAYLTPLSLALNINNYQIVKMLTQSPYLDLNEYANGKTALHSAVISENLKVVDLLLSTPNTDPNLITQAKGTSLNRDDPYLDGQNALHIAIQKRNYQIVKELLRREDLLINEPTNADPKYFDNIHNQYKYGCTPLYIACSENQTEMVSLMLMRSDIDINATSTKAQLTPLHIAIQKHNFQIVKELLEREDLLINKPTNPGSRYFDDYNIQYKNCCTPLYIACSENQTEMVSLMLLRSDIDINATSTNDKLTPLHIAAKKGYTDIVNILIADERCDTNATSLDGTNIVIFACQSSNINLLEMILARGVNALLTCKTANGNTPFHCVCLNNDANMLKVIIKVAKEHSYDINVKNNNGDTPLHIASKFNVSESLYKTYQRKYINNSMTSTTELVYINKYKTETCFGILLDYGADINVLNEHRQSPLYIACKNECYSNIEILMRRPEIIIEGDDKTSTPLMALISKLISSSDYVADSHYYGYRRGMSLSNSSSVAISRFLDRGAYYKFYLNNGISFLHFAIICKSSQYINFFFNNVPDDEVKSYLNHQTNYGSPIEAAIDNWSHEIMKILLKKKKDIIFDEKIRDQIIYRCASFNDTRSLVLLLLKDEEEENDPNFDFNVNYTNDEGNTPLHAAIKKNNSIITNILANYDKTDINTLNSDGRSVLHEACMSNDTIALALLTKVDLKNIKKMFDDDSQFNSSNFNRFLVSQSNSVSTLNPRISINLNTIGITRKEYIRRERQRILSKYPNTTQFHIHYIEPRFNNKFTALHISIVNRYENVVQKILLYPDLDINATTEHGDTAVSLAAKYWNERIAMMLIDYPGANINYVPKDEESDDEFDDEGNLKEKEKDDQNNKIDPTRPPHTLTSEELEEIREKREKQNKTLLHSAVEHNSIDVINHLLELSAQGSFDINGTDSYDGMAPLHYICQDGDLDLLELFVDFEENHPNIIDWNIKSKNGMTPLHFAARGKHTDIVDILINNEFVCPHVDINAQATGEFENGRTALSFACEKGLLDIVTLLLSDESTKKPKVVDDDDPFSFESESEQKKKQREEEEERKKKRLKRGSLCGADSKCNISLKSKAAHQRGMSPLHYACMGSNLELVRLLLQQGNFNINIRANGRSPLFLACQYNRPEIVRLLLQQDDINYNIKTPSGMTPLMIASQDGRYQIVEMLLQLRQIDTSALTVDGESARSLAKNHSIISLFDKYT